jgi:hypothetical protein
MWRQSGLYLGATDYAVPAIKHRYRRATEDVTVLTYRFEQSQP